MQSSYEVWGHTSSGEEIGKWTISNDAGMSVELTNMGAAIITLSVPDRNGQSANVNLGYDTAADYETNGSSFGVIVGRFANRINQGRFELDGVAYQLATNGGRHHIHGGQTGFARRLWRAVQPREFLPEMGEEGGLALDLHYSAADGEEGYPGRLDVTVTYIVHTSNKLTMAYEARTDKPTIINLTNHAYWNLGGEEGGAVLDHELQLSASRYLENDETTLPTGRILPVAGSAFDFLTTQTIGSRIEQAGNGYDNCYVIDGWDGKQLRPAAKIRDPRTGRSMEVATTEPGVQLYTANHFDGSAGCAGFGKHHAFCLECQHYPDSPNQPAFPSTVLRPGETYRQRTVHTFGAE
jgi:aldose 1-epimerase